MTVGRSAHCASYNRKNEISLRHRSTNICLMSNLSKIQDVRSIASSNPYFETIDTLSIILPLPSITAYVNTESTKHRNSVSPHLSSTHVVSDKLNTSFYFGRWSASFIFNNKSEIYIDCFITFDLFFWFQY